MKNAPTRDPIVQRILEKIPKDQQDSFTQDQLLALKMAFGARRWFSHPLDLRGSVKFWRWKFYYVILAGTEKRELSPAEKRLARMANITVISAFLTLSVLSGLLLLYLLKSALGIDLLPNFSLGIWSWFKKL